MIKKDRDFLCPFVFICSFCLDLSFRTFLFASEIGNTNYNADYHKSCEQQNEIAPAYRLNYMRDEHTCKGCGTVADEIKETGNSRNESRIAQAWAVNAPQDSGGSV